MKASGNFIVRVASELHAELRQVAAKRGVSLNSLCASLLQEGRHFHQGSTSDESKTSAVVRACRDAFGERLEGIVLFGSLARGEATATSDADLLLVLTAGTSIDRGLYREWDEIEVVRDGLAGHACSPQFVSVPDGDRAFGGLWYEVALDGQILWDHRGVVARVLRALRLQMLAGVVERRLTHGHPYWVKRHAQSHTGF